MFEFTDRLKRAMEMPTIINRGVRVFTSNQKHLVGLRVSDVSGSGYITVHPGSTVFGGTWSRVHWVGWQGAQFLRYLLVDPDFLVGEKLPEFMKLCEAVGRAVIPDAAARRLDAYVRTQYNLQIVADEVPANRDLFHLIQRAKKLGFDAKPWLENVQANTIDDLRMVLLKQYNIF